MAELEKINQLVPKHSAIRIRSTFDFTIVSTECFKNICELEVIELDSNFSDGQSLLSWSLKNR